MTVEAEKCVLAAACMVFALLTLFFIYREMMTPGFFSIMGMLACRYGMDTAK